MRPVATLWHQTLPDLAATEALGTRLAATLRPGGAILLEGPLGAGKSTLARALIRSATNSPALDVPSPTFTLVQAYDTRYGPLHHFDLWRLDGPSALAELGWDEARLGIVVVEWAERLQHLRPSDAIVISLALAGASERIATIEGWRG